MNGQHTACVTAEPGYPGRAYFTFLATAQPTGETMHNKTT